MENLKAYLHFGGPFTSEQPCPRITIEAQIKEDLLSWQKNRLMYTSTGFGSKIPTRYKVKHNNKWKRVYCAIYSNSGTCYILEGNKPVATVDICNY